MHLITIIAASKFLANVKLKGMANPKLRRGGGGGGVNHLVPGYPVYKKIKYHQFNAFYGAVL